MRNLRELRKTLEFYTGANKLKEVHYDEYTEDSIAMHLFGSMILAIAISSESILKDKLGRDKVNIGKAIRMAFLEAFDEQYPDYGFWNLKLKDQYLAEVDECHKGKTLEASLIQKCKYLDEELSEIISESEDMTEIKEEALEIISKTIGREPSKCEEILRFYFVNKKLRVTERSGWDNKHWNIKGKRETIAEHIIGTIALATVLSSEFKHNLDYDEIFKMLAIHEEGETLNGKDVTPFDGVGIEHKKTMEHAVWQKAIGKLKDRRKLLDILFDFDERYSNEGRFAYYCDKLEADLQAKLYQEKGQHHSLDDQVNNRVFNNKNVQEMLKNGAKTPFDIWYEWDKSIYSDEGIFTEFIDLLKATRDNEILKIGDGPFGNTIEEVVKLTHSEYYYLSERIVSICKEFYEKNSVDVIYMTCFQNSKTGTKNIKLTILRKPKVDSYKHVPRVDEINHSIEVINRTKVILAVEVGDIENYFKERPNTEEKKKITELTKSAILFDKTGKITELQKELSSCEPLFKPKHLYTVKYVPPVEEGIAKRIKKTTK